MEAVEGEVLGDDIVSRCFSHILTRCNVDKSTHGVVRSN